MRNKATIFKYASIVFSVACVALMIIYVYDRQMSTATWGVVAFIWALICHIFFKYNQKKGEDPSSSLKRRKK